MPKKFLRYYLCRIDLTTWKQLAEKIDPLKQWKFTSAGQFLDQYHSHGYPGGNKEQVVAEIKHHSLAGIVVEWEDPSFGGSVLWTNSPVNTELDDVLTLYSIAESRYTQAVIWEYGDGQTLTHGRRPDPFLHDSTTQPFRSVIDWKAIPDFISAGMKRLQDPGWVQNTGFLPAVLWQQQAQVAHQFARERLEFALYWVTLEVLARAHFDSLPANEKHKVSKSKGEFEEKAVAKMLQDFGFRGSSWGFVEDARKDWYKARNDAFHQGKRPEWSSTDPDRWVSRLRQIAEVTNLTLAQVIEPQPDWLLQQLGERIGGYWGGHA